MASESEYVSSPGTIVIEMVWAPKPLDCLPTRATTETITYAVHDSREKSNDRYAPPLIRSAPREEGKVKAHLR